MRLRDSWMRHFPWTLHFLLSFIGTEEIVGPARGSGPVQQRGGEDPGGSGVSPQDFDPRNYHRPRLTVPRVYERLGSYQRTVVFRKELVFRTK